ncbi:MAG: RsmE family RNA methyltransferase [Planctomycetota bacterium]
MTRRYYAPQLPGDGGLVSLSSEEAAHAARVMRAQVGEVITLFDGNGNESSAEIVSISKRDCVCRANPTEPVDREPRLKLHLAIALPKPDRAKEMIERLTELGVDRLTPLRCARSQRAPSPGLLEKLPRIVIEACKQSGRNRLLRIDDVSSFADFIQLPLDSPRWIAHPGGQPLPVNPSPTDRAIAIVGPEGGLTDEEVTTAQTHGYQGADLGPRILRIETAAAFIAARLL